MDKITSDTNLEIYNDDRNIRVLAGPGAGKTHLLIENIKHIIKKSNRIKINNRRKILCITYTNSAVAEITKRLGSFSKYVIVCTIHSFINEYIILPFQQQLKLFIKHKFDMDIPQNIKISSVQEGFTVLSGHKKEDIYAWIQNKYPDIKQEEYNTLSRPKMSNVVIDISNKNTYPFNKNADVSMKTPKDINPNLIYPIKKYIWAVAGKLSFDEILYFGLSLTEKYPIILYILRAEFPYVIMDEYQDTNPIQNRLLNLISEKECSVVIVGDISQSIYSFQGATYHEFKNFNLQSCKTLETKIIEGNRRSTQNIINLINFIRKNDADLKQDCIKNIANNEKVTFLIQQSTTLKLPLYKLIDNDTHILCRKWTEAFKYIDNVTPDQMNLINNIYNAYTYISRREMKQEIENRHEAWICSVLDIAELEEAFNNKDIPKALKVLEKYIDIQDLFKDFEKEKLQKLQYIIHLWESIFVNDLSNLTIKNLITLINTKLTTLENINILEQFRYPNNGDEDYFEPVYKHVDTLTYSCAKKIVLELFSDNSKYMTIHQAKGREFNSVLVNLEPFAKGAEKDFNPTNIFTNPQIISEDRTNAAYEEYTRIAYVGCSRAINKLYIHLKGDSNTKLYIEKALKTYYINDKTKQDFFDFVFC